MPANRVCRPELLLLVFIVIAAWPKDAAAQWVSPGPLAKAHEDLDRSDRCDKCHAPGAGVLAQRCLACHAQVGGPPGGRDTWHYRVQVKASGKKCQDCHSDHRGRSYPLIRWTPPADFDHKATGFALEGAHAKSDCGECHKKQPKYMGLRDKCASCHKDAHKGQLGDKCDRCHTTTAFLPASKFEHSKTKFKLEGKHASVACAECHKPRPDGLPKYEKLRFKDCADCHSDPHQGKTFLSDCSTCHTVAGWEKTRGLPPSHGPAGWPLRGAHAKVSCVDCHGADLARNVARDCVSCHADIHKGRFGPECTKCHNETSWKQQKLAGFDHAQTRYPLRGRHAVVKCEKCHRPGKGKKTVYRGLKFGLCTDCHNDPHKITYTSVAPPVRCTACHDENGFVPANYGLEEHQKARYQLTGSHAAVSCAKCHTKGQARIVRLAVKKTRCIDCHKDPHGAQFKDVVDTKGCEGCHTTTGFRIAAFDHDKTKLKLEGVHAKAACGSCHKGKPIQYRGLPLKCEGCHADVHRGQFRAAPKPKGCPACHSQDTFKIKQFDHNRLTAYPLDGKHAKVACEKCHKPVQVKDGALVPYRIGKKTCAECHVNPHGTKER